MGGARKAAWANLALNWLGIVFPIKKLIFTGTSFMY